MSKYIVISYVALLVNYSPDEHQYLNSVYHWSEMEMVSGRQMSRVMRCFTELAKLSLLG